MATGTISTLGLGSGLDISSILESLQEADEVVITNKETQIAEFEASQDEFNVLNSLLLDMKSSASSLSLSSNFLERSVSMSSEILSVSSTDGAATGTYDVEINRLASKSSYTSEGMSASTDSVYVPTSQTSNEGFSNTDTDIILAEDEEMTITYGDDDDLQTITIIGGAGGYTLDNLEAAINSDTSNDDGDGGTYVTAAITTDDDGLYHLNIAASSGGSGKDNQVDVTADPDATGFTADKTTFSYSVGDTEVSLSLIAGTTLEDLVTQINEGDDNPGVTASVVDTGYGDNPYKLVLTADDAGEDNRITITQGLADLALNEQNGAGYIMTSESSLDLTDPVIIRQADANTDIVFQEVLDDGSTANLTATIEDGVYYSGDDLATAVEAALENASMDSGNGIDYQVAWNDSTGKLELSEVGNLESLTISWSDAGSTAASFLGFSSDQTLTPSESSLNAEVAVDNITYQRQSNSGHTDLVSGMSISFSETGSTTITVDEETESIEEDITNIVDLFNDLINEINDNDDYDEDEETWGTLAKYSSVDTMKSNLLSLFQTQVDTEGAISSFYDLGFEIDENGNVSIDTDTLSEALENNFDDVQAFFIGDDDNDIEGMGDQFNDHLLELTKLGGYIEAETGAIDDKIYSLEDSIEQETERIEKKYETLTTQYIEMDSYMSEMESMQSYVSEIFSATASDDD